MNKQKAAAALMVEAVFQSAVCDQPDAVVQIRFILAECHRLSVKNDIVTCWVGQLDNRIDQQQGVAEMDALLLHGVHDETLDIDDILIAPG